MGWRLSLRSLVEWRLSLRSPTAYQQWLPVAVVIAGWDATLATGMVKKVVRWGSGDHNGCGDGGSDCNGDNEYFVFPRGGGFKISVTGQLNNKFISFSTNSSSVTPQLADQKGEVELLSAFNDDHGGVIVEMKAPMSSKDFISLLRASMMNWKQQGKRGVWLKLPIELANLVQPAVEEGFWYHHAEPSYLMLAYWIPATTNTLPVNATHRVGVGAFVMNDKGEVLAVQERSGKFHGSGVWKFPTGVVDQGEDIFAGAIREVKEETGVDTKFVEVLAFRQSHMSFFEKSDLFFVCMLHPLSFEIRKQESEIAAAQWMPINEFAAQPFAQKHELLKSIIAVGLAKAKKSYSGFAPRSIKSAFTDRQSYFYSNEKGLDGKV